MPDKNSRPSRLLGFLSAPRATPPASTVPPLDVNTYDNIGYEAAPLPADFKPYDTLKEARTGKRNAPAA